MRLHRDDERAEHDEQQARALVRQALADEFGFLAAHRLGREHRQPRAQLVLELPELRAQLALEMPELRIGFTLIEDDPSQDRGQDRGRQQLRQHRGFHGRLRRDRLRRS